ncbi:MAG: tetratricopeptide repeat protein [Pirellulaceae bacterium]
MQKPPRVANNLQAVKNSPRDLKDLEKAVLHNPELAEAFILMAKLETPPGGSREKARRISIKPLKCLPTNRLINQMHTFSAGLQENNDDKLIDLQKAIEVNPTNTEALQAKIAMQLALGKLQEVVDDAERMMAEDEDNLFAFEAAVQALAGLEKYDEAIELLTKRIAKDDSNGNFYRIRGQIYLAKKEDDKAMEDLNKAIELNNRDAAALIMRGRMHYLAGEVEKANRDISDALLIAPDSVDGVLMRSLVAAQEGRYGDAIADMELLVRAAPNNVDWIMQLASYYQMDKRPRLAIRLLDEVIQNDDKDWRALRLRGDAKLSIAMHDEAVADYDEAISILERDRAVPEEQKSSDLDYSGLLNNLSWVLATSPNEKLRDGKKALELGLKASEASEYKQAHILSTLAAAYAETGDFEKAREWSAKAVALAEEEEKQEPGSSQIEQLREELESYKKDKPWREEQKTEENEKPFAAATESIDT